MNCELIITSTYYQCIDALADLLKDASLDMNQSYVVFTEDKYSLEAERKVAAAQKCGGFFNIEIFTFSRFINSVLNIKNKISKQGGIVIIKQILKENADKLTCFKKNLTNKNTPAAVFDIISSFKSSEIKPADLRPRSEIPQPFSGTQPFSGPQPLSGKLADLALIYEEYEKFLKDKYLDGGALMALLIKEIQKSGLIKNSHVYLCGYDTFTKQGEAVLKALLTTAKSVTGIFCGSMPQNINSPLEGCPPQADGVAAGGSDAIYTNESVNIFKNIAGAPHASRLTSHLSPLTSHLSPLASHLSPLASHLKKHLFNPGAFAVKETQNAAERRQKTENIIFYRAENPYEEISFICTRIKLEAQRGIKYGEITLACGNIESYSHIISEVFENFKIPVFIDKKKNASENILSRLVQEFLKCIIYNHDFENAMPLFKNIFFCTDKNLTDEFENYALKYNIKYNGFFKALEAPSAETPPHDKLTEFEALRKKYAGLFAGANNAGNAPDADNLILNLFKKLNVQEQIARLEQSYENEALNEIKAAKQIYNKILTFFSEIRALSGSKKLSVYEYYDILNSFFESTEIALVPAFSNAVIACGVNEVFEKKKILFCAGLTSEVPSVKADNSIINDAEINMLEKLKLSLSPKVFSINAREREKTCVSLLSADKLYLCFPQVSFDGKINSKSEIFKYIDAVFCSASGKDLPYLSNETINLSYERLSGEQKNRLASVFYISLRPGLCYFADNLYKYKHNETGFLAGGAAEFYNALYELNMNKDADEIYDKITNTEQNVSYGTGYPYDNRISASEIETYYACPAMHFYKYALRAHEREVYEIKPIDYGKFLHEAAEKFVKRIDEVNDDNLDIIINEIFEEIQSDSGGRYKIFDSSEKYRFMLLRLKKECARAFYYINRQIKQSKFKSIGQEIVFGRGKENIFINYGDEKIIFEGVIDRADEYNGFIRIIDYKTGNIFDSDNYFYAGIKLQLFLYLKAFTENKRCAGAYYFKMHDDFGDESDNYALIGHTLKDIDIIFGMDSGLSADNLTGSNINVKLKIKNGEYVLSNSTKFLSENQFNAYLKYAEKLAENAVKCLKEGKYTVSPYEKACRFCKALGSCMFDEEEGFRNVSGVKPELIEQITNYKR